jgi:hypothetical protein
VTEGDESRFGCILLDYQFSEAGFKRLALFSITFRLSKWVRSQRAYVFSITFRLRKWVRSRKALLILKDIPGSRKWDLLMAKDIPASSGIFSISFCPLGR